MKANGYCIVKVLAALAACGVTSPQHGRANDLIVEGNLTVTGVTASAEISVPRGGRDLRIEWDFDSYPGLVGDYGDLYFGEPFAPWASLNYYSGEGLEIGGIENPAEQMVRIYGRLEVTNTVSAVSFTGDGSNLQNVAKLHAQNTFTEDLTVESEASFHETVWLFKPAGDLSMGIYTNGVSE